MSGSVNKCILIGNVARDPEIRDVGHDGKVANVVIATSERWTDKKSGERKEKSEFHRVSIFGRNAENVEKYVSKGDKLYVEGALQTRKWQDSQGQDKYTTEIVVGRFNGTVTFLSPPNRGGSDRQEQGYASAPAPQEPAGGYERELKDEIPF